MYYIKITWSDGREVSYEYASLELAKEHFEGFKKQSFVAKAELLEAKRLDYYVRQADSTSH